MLSRAAILSASNSSSSSSEACSWLVAVVSRLEGQTIILFVRFPSRFEQNKYIVAIGGHYIAPTLILGCLHCSPSSNLLAAVHSARQPCPMLPHYLKQQILSPVQPAAERDNFSKWNDGCCECVVPRRAKYGAAAFLCPCANMHIF